MLPSSERKPLSQRTGPGALWAAVGVREHARMVARILAPGTGETLTAWNRRSARATPLPNPQTEIGAPQRRLRLLEVHRALATGDRLLRATPGGLGAFDVDLLGAFGAIGEDKDLVVSDLHEPAVDQDRLLVVPLLDPELSKREGRDQGGVLGKNAQHAGASRGDDHIDVLVLEDDALSRDDLYVQLTDHDVRSFVARGCRWRSGGVSRVAASGGAGRYAPSGGEGGRGSLPSVSFTP